VGNWPGGWPSITSSTHSSQKFIWATTSAGRWGRPAGRPSNPLAGQFPASVLVHPTRETFRPIPPVALPVPEVD
jgi:hypothetical protein